MSVMDKDNTKPHDEQRAIASVVHDTHREKEEKTLRDIAKPIINTKGFKLDREEANKRR